MTGRVVVDGNATQSAGATAHGGLLVIDGNASARCGISMKGVDIVVGGSIGHMSAFMAQAGRLVVLRRRRRGARRLDLRGPHLRARRRSPRSAPTASRRSCGDEHLAELARPARPRPASTGDDAGDFRRYGSARQLYHFHVDNVGSLLMSRRRRPARLGLRESATFRPRHHRRHPARRRDGIYDIRGWGAKRRAPALRRPAVPRRVAVALPAGGLPRALRHRRRARRPAREEAAAPGDPGHDRRHELRRAVRRRPRRRSAAAPARSAPRPPPATAA